MEKENDAIVVEDVLEDNIENKANNIGNISNISEEYEDVIKFKKLYDFNIDENYEYFKEGKLFKIASNILYYGIAYPILSILNKIIYDLKIEGKENIKNLNTGAISVSNHVLVLDCSMIGLAIFKRRVYFTTREESFKIPFVRKLIKLLGAIPIPKSINNKKYFLEAIKKGLDEGKIIQIYPEGVLKPYCENIRNLRDGAFKIAKETNKPIIPIRIKFRDPSGIRKFFKKKKDVTVKVYSPVIAHGDYKDLKNKVEELLRNDD